MPTVKLAVSSPSLTRTSRVCSLGTYIRWAVRCGEDVCPLTSSGIRPPLRDFLPAGVSIYAFLSMCPGADSFGAVPSIHPDTHEGGWRTVHSRCRWWLLLLAPRKTPRSPGHVKCLGSSGDANKGLRWLHAS